MSHFREGRLTLKMTFLVVNMSGGRACCGAEEEERGKMNGDLQANLPRAVL